MLFKIHIGLIENPRNLFAEAGKFINGAYFPDATIQPLLYYRNAAKEINTKIHLVSRLLLKEYKMYAVEISLNLNTETTRSTTNKWSGVNFM